MHWRSVIAEHEAFDRAVEAAVEGMTAALGGEQPSLLVAFVSDQYGSKAKYLPEALETAFPDALLFGCSASGVIGAGTEVEDRAAVSLTAAVLPDVAMVPFHLMQGDLPEPTAVDFWQHLLGLDPDQGPSFLILADPFSIDPMRLLNGLDTAYPRAPKVGGLASGGRSSGDNLLYLDGEVHHAGVIGLALYGDIQMDPVVAQGCKPIGPLRTITQGSAQFIRELDSRPVTEVLEETFHSLSAEDQHLFRHALFVGFAAEDEVESPTRGGSFLIRNILGVDPVTGVLVVGARVRPGTRVRLHVRDAGASAQDLDIVLGRQQQRNPGDPPQGALLFSCLGRGRSLYGRPGHDSERFQSVFGPVPVGGFFCNGEIGPVHGNTVLHGFTSSFALFRPRSWN